MSTESRALALPTNPGMPTNASVTEIPGGSAEGIRGSILRVSGKDGAIVSGAKGSYEHKPSERFAVCIGEGLLGYIEWRGNDPIAKHWAAPLIQVRGQEVDLTDYRAGLGNTDESKWVERTLKGAPRDPMRLSFQLPMIAENGEEFTLCSSSIMQVRFIQGFAKACLRDQEKDPRSVIGCLPVARLDVGMLAPKGGASAIFYPDLRLLGWASYRPGSALAFDAIPDEPPEEEPEEDRPPARRRRPGRLKAEPRPVRPSRTRI
jgi:hypothetical protein